MNSLRAILDIAYNAAGEITRVEERKADGRLLNLQDFAYDDAGRVAREFIAPIPQPYSIPTHTVTYDNDNRIATFNGLNVVHDADGNMTSGPLDADSLETYAYDARNRLTSAGGVSYTYDPENNRVAETDASGTTEYTVEPNTGLSKMLIRTKPDGTKTFYVYGMGLLYQVDENENTLTYHYDYRGSTRQLTSDDGQTVTDVVEYSPYGRIVHRTGSTDTPFLYNGMYGVMTSGNGLLHMRARFYNPYTRRFVNADPIGFAGGMNWYAYASGNPISRIDPQGTYDGGSTTIVGSALSGEEGWYGSNFSRSSSGSEMSDLYFQMSVAHKEVLALSEMATPRSRGIWGDGNRAYRGYSPTELREIAFRESNYLKYGRYGLNTVKVAGFALDGYLIAEAEPGKERNDAIASAAGSTGGALGGAAIGTAVGNLPGGIIGAFLGGVGGSSLDSDDLGAVADTYRNNPLPIILVY